MGGGKRLARYVHVTDDKGEQHVFGPDDDVPGWAAKVITNPAAWGDDSYEDAPLAPPTPSSTSGDDDGDGGVPAYGSMKKAELEAEVARRNEGREEVDHIQVGGNGTKADLVAALVADDEALGD